MLATGGAGQAYPLTTNPGVATGDGMAMAARAKAAVANLEFVQFHPTALAAQGCPGWAPGGGGGAAAQGERGGRARVGGWVAVVCASMHALGREGLGGLSAPPCSPTSPHPLPPPGAAAPPGRAFLITEAVRGEGGVLTDLAGRRFMARHDPRGELAPRDIVARAIQAEMRVRGGCVCVGGGGGCTWWRVRAGHSADARPRAAHAAPPRTPTPTHPTPNHPPQERDEAHVLLDISHKPAAEVLAHFPNVAAHCASLGVDITKVCWGGCLWGWAWGRGIGRARVVAARVLARAPPHPTPATHTHPPTPLQAGPHPCRPRPALHVRWGADRPAGRDLTAWAVCVRGSGVQVRAGGVRVQVCVQGRGRARVRGGGGQ